jgi:glycine/D-amino acid oxidase-like deaminating enzyme
VLERSHVSAGSSALSAGVYNVNATDPFHVEIRVRSREIVDALERDHGLHVSRNGHMRLGRSERHLELFEGAVAMQQELGIEPSAIIHPAEARRLVPGLRVDDVIAALYNRLDGHIDGPLTCGVLLDIARSHGGELRSQTAVTRLESGKDRRHRLVVGDGGHVDADVVVNAAGPWAERVGELLGAPLPLTNELHEMLRVRLPEPLARAVPMVQEYIPGDDKAIYFRQDDPQHLIGGLHTYEASGAASEDPDTFRRSVSEDSFLTAAQRIGARLPVAGLGFAPLLTGLYPIGALDGNPMVGPYRHDPTIVAAGGFGGVGLCYGLSLGRCVAEWVVHGEPRTVPAASRLLPDRPGGVT